MLQKQDWDVTGVTMRHFADDELVAYGTKLMLLHRWHRLGQEVPGTAAKAVTAE